MFARLLYFAAKSFEKQSRTAVVSSIYCTLLGGNEKKKSILLLQEAVKLPRFSSLDRKTTHTVSFYILEIAASSQTSVFLYVKQADEVKCGSSTFGRTWPEQLRVL